MHDKIENWEELRPGDKHYKAYVGPPKMYDQVGAMQFNLLTAFGLRDFHKLLDIGCGSLRSGKLFIPYLRKGNYFGIEPNEWLIEDGIKYELGQEIIELKEPHFNNSEHFDLQVSISHARNLFKVVGRSLTYISSIKCDAHFLIKN